MKKILSLLCLMMLAMTSAWADDVKVTWAMGASTDAVAVPVGNATGAISIGDGLSNVGALTWSDIVFTKFQATSSEKGSNSHASAESMKKYVDFKVTPVGGKFTPTKVSFDIIKIGTGDPSAYVDFIDGEGNTITVADNVTIRRNQDGTDAISHSFTISGAESSANAATLHILVGKLANNKQVGIANVVVEGAFVSDEPVAENKTIFLVPGPWDVADATERYAAYVWTGEGDAKVESWIPFVENSGKLSTIIPSSFTGLILARMDGASTENVWGNVWNQTADIDFTAVADQSIFTITGWDANDYTISNLLQEAREQLSKVIALAEMLKSADLAGSIATAKTFLTSTDVTAIADAMQTLLNDVKPVAADKLNDLKAMATKYGYNDLAEEIENVATAINAVTPDIDAITTQLASLVAQGKAAGVQIMEKVAGYAEALDNETLNAAIATATATVTSQTSTISEIVDAVETATTAFKTAAAAFVQTVAAEQIEDANVQAKLAAIAALGENPSLADYAEAVRQLIVAYQAYQLEQNPVYTVAGTTALTGYNWDTSKNLMTLNQETGLYEWTAKFIAVPGDLKFKVVRNYKWETSWPENDWVITPESLDGEGVYSTITITFNADSKVIGVTGVKRVSPVFAENNVYYWESPDGYQDQNGGVAVHNNDGNRVNYPNEGYYTICLNGKNDFSSDVVTITLNDGNTLKAGDVIAITAYRNKDQAGKESAAKLKFNNSDETLNIGVSQDGKGLEFNNINTAEAVAAEYGEPNTITATVPEAADGSTTITMTRSITGTNLFITKIEITRPIEYYLVGNFNLDGENKWVVGDANYKLAKNEEAATEEYSITVALPASTELKVWKNTDKWFPADDAPNFTINDAGTYTIYFRPNADGGDDWYQNCIYAQWVHGAVTLNEESDNTETLAAWNGREADVTLTRTLQTGGWNTFAVPFNQEIPTEWTVKELASTSLNGETLTLTFQDATTSFEAGKPYLVKVPGTVENPTFYNVTISNEVAATETDYVDFIPTLGKTEISATGGITKENVLFIGEGNRLHNPTELPANMKGFRAYFLLKGANAARSFVLDFGDGETTGIIEIETMKNVANQAVYDLQGRRVNSAAQKGVYIVNGKKTVIK